jgi:hypothetical protein
LVANQTIEPVQIAGFQQFFDDITATDARRYGLGMDYQAADSLSVGAQATTHNLALPQSTSRATRSLEHHHLVYVYWVPLSQISVSAEYRYDDYERDPYPVDVGSPFKLRTHSVPLTLAYFHPSGLLARVRGTHFNQKLEQILASSAPPETQSDVFNLMDIGIGYRLPKRYGLIMFTVTNVFDTQFNFQDTNFITANDQVPEIKPERQYIVKATLRF